MAPNKLEYKSLKAKQRELRDGFTKPLTLRVHRALSWLGRAEQECDDNDVAFILLWVSFNAAYAEEIGNETSETDAFRKFFETMVAQDEAQIIYNLVWTRFSKEIRLLLDNQFIYAPYWKFVNGDSHFADWQKRMSADKERVNKCLARKDTAQILYILFGRLYVLRNQLVHGGATWNSSINRDQINDCKAFLSNIIPVFIEIMMENPAHEWKMPFYSVIED